VVALGGEKSKLSKCKWTARSPPFVVVGSRCPRAGQPGKLASPFGRLLPQFWHWRLATASGEIECQLSHFSVGILRNPCTAGMGLLPTDQSKNFDVKLMPSKRCVLSFFCVLNMGLSLQHLGHRVMPQPECIGHA
jgi:hypothetical protein